MKEKIKKIFEKYNILLNKNQILQFEKYYQFLVEENKKYNLTSITEEDDVIFKHFLDSVLPEKLIDKNAKCVDVGSGAGFPAIPLKIVRPDVEICMVDSLQKRVNFLNQTINLLKLENITAFHARVEDFAIKNREKFDYALSRAVAQVPTLAEYLIPLVKVNGKVIMYKSQKVEEELMAGEKAIKEFGGQVAQVIKMNIEEIEAERNFIVIKKVQKTPQKYPRGKNLPSRNSGDGGRNDNTRNSDNRARRACGGLCACRFDCRMREKARRRRRRGYAQRRAQEK